MPKCMLNLCVFFLVAAGAISQTVDDSSTVSTLEPDSTAVDSSTAMPPDSAAIDSAMTPEPLFDFRANPTAVMKALYHDSTFIIGARYTSFGDVFDRMPGAYYYNLGTPGQLAFGSIFGAPPGEMLLDYDGLILNHPITDLADFNVIPTESMAHAGIVHSAHKTFGFMPIGQAFQFESHTIANNPIRSQVGYRTGYYQYDDVDVRLGIQASPKFWLDFGGVLKGYGGYTPNAAYSGTKVNAKLNRRLGSNWLLRYVMLLNMRDTEIPLPGPLQDAEFADPKQKDGRIDHAVQLRYKNNFFTTLQYAQFEEELRARDKSVFFEQNEAQVFRATTEYNLFWKSIRWRNGASARLTRAQSNTMGDHGDWQTDLYSSLNGSFLSQLHWHAAIDAEKRQGYQPQINPELNLFFAIDSTAALNAWASRTTIYPSLKAQYSIGPFATGATDLTFAAYNQLGLAAEKQFATFFVYGSAVYMQRKNPRYVNMPSMSTLTADLSLDYTFLPKWRVFAQGTFFTDFDAQPTVTHRPQLYSKFFLQYHLIAFKGDLNARLRAGAFVLGPRYGPAPFYAHFSNSTVELGPAVYPYFHAILKYRTAEIFFAYENYIDADVQYVYGYSMPQLWFRYGFIWHFVD